MLQPASILSATHEIPFLRTPFTKGHRSSFLAEHSQL